MAGYWQRSIKRPINSQKKEQPRSSHLDRTNLVNKGSIILLLGKLCLQDTVGSPEGARWLHLGRSGSQSQLANWVIFPVRGASHIINQIIEGKGGVRHLSYNGGYRWSVSGHSKTSKASRAGPRYCICPTSAFISRTSSDTLH